MQLQPYRSVAEQGIGTDRRDAGNSSVNPEGRRASQTTASFAIGDAENPFNWSNVSAYCKILTQS